MIASDAGQIVWIKETERMARDYDADIEIYNGIGHLKSNGVGWETVADRTLGWLVARGL